MIYWRACSLKYTVVNVNYSGCGCEIGERGGGHWSLPQ